MTYCLVQRKKNEICSMTIATICPNQRMLFVLHSFVFGLVRLLLRHRLFRIWIIDLYFLSFMCFMQLYFVSLFSLLPLLPLCVFSVSPFSFFPCMGAFWCSSITLSHAPSQFYAVKFSVFTCLSLPLNSCWLMHYQTSNYFFFLCVFGLYLGPNSNIKADNTANCLQTLWNI